MKKGVIQLKDTIEFKPIELSQKQKDNYYAGATSQPLIVRIAATHAGLITRNNGFYLPDKMRKGAPTFTAQYSKPIQVHHSDHQDPVGRILKADYVDISASATRLLNKKDSLLVDKFTKFIDGKLPFIESINFICDELNRKKDSVLDDPDYQGMGFIKLTAQISDPEAIKKVLDGRYLTGSVGLTTDSAICSVCKEDWTDSGPCEHKPGKMYDDTRAFIITGNLVYDEYSFVNTPADRHSRVIEINANGVTDSVEMTDSVGKTIAVNLITDNIQEDNMKSVAERLISDKRFAILGEEFLKGLKDSLEDQKTFSEKFPFTDELDFTVNFETFLDEASIGKIFALTDGKAAALLVVRPFLTEEDVKSVIEDKAITKSEDFYKAINDIEWNDYSDVEDELLAKYLEENKEDAKLSTKQRKGLAGSTFCGPNRSFPVPDCSHVTAARRLIGRASASGATKKRILACVSRKASAMNCDAKLKEENKQIADKKDTAPVVDKDVKAQLDKLTVELAKITIERDKLAGEKDKLVKDLTIATDKLSANEKLLDATREELKLTQDDLTVMADQLINVNSTVINHLVDKLITMKTLAGEKIEDKTKEELSALSEKEISDKLTEITAKVDMKKIIDTISSGLTNTAPNKKVADPTLNTEKNKKVFDKNMIEKISQEYIKIQLGGNSAYGRGPQAAERFKQDMQVKGLLPTG